MRKSSQSGDPPPPTLPPRPEGKSRPVPSIPVEETFTPQEPDEVYDDCGEDPSPEYDDCERDMAPPLPPHPEAFYDDVGEHSAPTLPQRPPPSNPSQPPLSAPQEYYDDLGPIVQHIPKRQLPPRPPGHSPPAQVTKAPPQSPALPPPPPILDDPGAVYEVEPDVDPQPSMPPPPAPAPMLPPKSSGPPKLPPQPPKPVTSPGPKGKGPSTGFSMDAGQLQGVLAGLKKVSVDNTSSSSSDSKDSKTYDKCPDTVYEAKKMFQNKADGKPEILPPKPSVGVASVASVAKGDGSSSGGKAGPGSQPAKGPKPNSEHGSPPPLSPHKPVTKPAPKVEEMFDEPDDIYDEAASAVPDPLARFDWYHGNIPRQLGEQRVRSVGKDGGFLVRVSEKDPKFPFTLVVLHNKQVNNLRIRKRADDKVALGDEKTGELAFAGVPMMIEHHRKHDVVLLGNNQSQVKLQHVAPKS